MKKFTLCLYQDYIALPDIQNWVELQKSSDRLKSIETIKHEDFEYFIVELSYGLYEETVYIFPASCAGRLLRSLLNRDGLFPIDLLGTVMKENFKFIYTGAIVKKYSSSIFNLYNLLFS